MSNTIDIINILIYNLLIFKEEKLKTHKHLRVSEETHMRVKALAVFKGMTIDQALNFLIDEHNKNSKPPSENYRKRT